MSWILFKVLPIIYWIILIALPLLLGTRLFVTKTADGGIEIKKKRLLVTFASFAIFCLGLGIVTLIVTRSLLRGGTQTAYDSVNANRRATQRLHQALDVLYPHSNVQCAWNTASSFTQDIWEQMFHKMTCEEPGRCSRDFTDYYVKLRPASDSIFLDFGLVGLGVGKIWQTASESYRVVRSMADHLKPMTEEERKDNAGGFYVPEAMSPIIANWEDRRKNCMTIKMPAWALHLNEPMPMIDFGGLALRAAHD